MNRYQVIIIGKGLAGLTSAVRLTELGVNNILVVGSGAGATPGIAAINFVLPQNPYGDSPELYQKDMTAAGYRLGTPKLLEDMAQHSYEGYELLLRHGASFAQEHGRPKLRHLSGHSVPRSLCRTDGLIGAYLAKQLISYLEYKGVTFTQKRCVRLLSDGNRVYGATLLDYKRFPQIDNVYSSAVIAAWGGVGSLFERTTYPQDIFGETLAMGWRAGAALTDIEFVEYEPMVVLSPWQAAGEPCPTAMLGEGAHLLNNKGERLLLPIRPQGEVSTPKSIINQMIHHEAEAKRGSAHGGVFVDLRHIPRRTLANYPWFYNRMIKSGVDPCDELLEVGPVAHSLSGGIMVNRDYQSTIKGLFAVGEAAGGVHGACRCAGNAASQAVISGMLCANALVQDELFRYESRQRFPCERRMEQGIFRRFYPAVQRAASLGLGLYRCEKDIKKSLDDIEEILTDRAAYQDESILDHALSVKLMLTASYNRRESRGVFQRTDAPETLEEYQRHLPLLPDKVQ